MIDLFIEDGGWMSKDSDPEVKRLFGTDTLPTPFSTATPASQVFAVIQELNPGVEVRMRGGKQPVTHTDDSGTFNCQICPMEEEAK